MKAIVSTLIGTLFVCGALLGGCTVSTLAKPGLSTEETLVTTTMGPDESSASNGPLTLRAGQTIADCTVRVSGDARGITGYGASGSVIRNVTVEGGHDGIKIGSGAQTNGLTVTDLRVTGNSGVSLFLANVTTARIAGLSTRTSGYSLYLERGNHELSFRDVELSSTGEWAVHVYNWETQDEPSTDLLIDRGTINASQGGFVLSGGWSGITIANLKIHSTSSAWPIFRLYGGVKDVLIEDVEVWGGSALLDVVHGTDRPADIILRNVVYHGETLVPLESQAAIEGLVMENVVISGDEASRKPTADPALRASFMNTRLLTFFPAQSGFPWPLCPA